MMLEKDDLGLSLSLSFPQNPKSLPCNLQKPSWNDGFPSSDRNSETCRAETRAFLRGIDVNRFPSTADCEEEAGVSSPNSTISSVSGKRSEREANGEDHEIERECSRGISDEEDGDASRKKLRLSKDQSAILEETFKEHNTLNPKQKSALAKQLGLRPRQVEVWFQNRRARTKLKQTEVDCEYLKRCCENLTEENRRLQKEVQELRALKLSPQFYMHMTPPTTLTMCPSCERVAVPPSSSTAHSRPIPINQWATVASTYPRVDCKIPPCRQSQATQPREPEEISAPSSDIGWQFGKAKGNRHIIVCIFCGKIVTGGITGLKQHITAQRGVVAACERVSADVRKLTAEHLKATKKKKLDKKQADKELRETLRPEDSDDEEDQEFARARFESQQ